MSCGLRSVLWVCLCAEESGQAHGGPGHFALFASGILEAHQLHGDKYTPWVRTAWQRLGQSKADRWDPMYSHAPGPEELCVYGLFLEKFIILEY